MLQRPRRTVQHCAPASNPTWIVDPSEAQGPAGAMLHTLPSGSSPRLPHTSSMLSVSCRQDARLTALWEQYGGRPGHLDRIAS